MLAKLLKFAPTLVVILICGALLMPYLDRSSAAHSASKVASEAGPSIRIPKNTKSGQPARDPFHLAGAAPVERVEDLSSKKDVPAPDARQQELDRLQEIVEGLNLGGTYIDGRKRLAIIGGKVYAEDDRILDEDGEATGLIVRSVAADRVKLVGLGKDFPLTYPDRIVSQTAEEEEAPPATAEAALRALMNNPDGQRLDMLPLLMNGEGGGISGILANLLYNQFQGGEGLPAGVRPNAARARAARAATAGAAAPAGGDPALYAAAAPPKSGKGKASKAAAGPVGGDPALYADAAGSKGSGKKSAATGAKKSAPAGGDPALYGGDTKKKGGRSKR